MLGPLLSGLLPVLFPKIPMWVHLVLGDAIPAIVRLVRTMETDDTTKGPDKARKIIIASRQAMDEALDEIPEWREISEARRDRILGGIAELALFFTRLEEVKEPAKLRKLRKKIAKRLRTL